MPGVGRRFLFYGKFKSLPKAQAKEASETESFIIPCGKSDWCVVKDRPR